ncbi:MAG TPA: hypothetical protein VLB51_05280 [Methylomirabilota bacterium]|nr:hypothetical protein [Methylomirabilota bacterium]
MKTALRIVCLLVLLVGPAAGQEILFDQMVEAGGLKCYPVYGDASSWYYLPDQPHVATTGEAQRPEFSFLMYTTPEQRGEEGITSAPGGGVAHMLVAYDVPEDMVRRAQSELQRTKPGAQLKGPVAYTDGTFNLVTAVTDPEAGLSRRVVGVGNAPVMSGHKAAVSMHLTPTGAMLLWESFSQRTPDISVNFEMTVSGYRNPVEATMTFDYERIHETTQLQAGIESRYLEADVDVLLGKMVDNGSISIELKGAPPEQWAEVQKLGLELAKHHLFENMGAAPLSEVTTAARAAGSSSRSSDSSSSGAGSSAPTPRPSSSSSPSDSSSGSSATATPTPRPSGGPGAAARRDDRRVLTDREHMLEWAAVEQIVMVALPPPPDLGDEARDVLDRVQELYREGRFRESLDRIEGAAGLADNPQGLLWAALNHLRLGNRDECEDALRRFVAADGVDRGAMTAFASRVRDSEDRLFNASPESRQARAEVAEELLEAGQQAMGTTGSADAEVPSDPRSSGAATASATSEATPSSSIREETTPEDGDDELPLRRLDFDAEDEPELRRIRPSDRQRPQLRESDQDEEEPVRVTVSFRMRRIERRGSFTFNMKQWNRVEIPVRFAANIGDLSRYKDDPRMFRRVSLADPMFKQREIPVSIDVASEEAFAAMLNAVAVTIRKRHQSGRETVDEAIIQPGDFASGALESVLYGWDGDDDRTAWLDYDYRVRWSYAGGPTIETDWVPTSAGALVLTPPLRPRELVIEADPTLLREQGVRAVVVQVSYDARGVERSSYASIRPTSETGSHQLVVYQDPQRPEYAYSFDWRLYGGQRRTVGPFTDVSDFIFVDEIPR